MSSGIFRFKQFSINQSGCAMKINTDGVLLGALAEADGPDSILDIGTGTGVIALMLAQRFSKAQIDAVEIDTIAAQTAALNFQSSPFFTRLAVYPQDFREYFKQYPDRKYSLIISNPPFYINSLNSPGQQINVAKHTNQLFFYELLASVAKHLAANGTCWLILPVQTAHLVKTMLPQNNLWLQNTITIRSFAGTDPHREIFSFGTSPQQQTLKDFTIYDAPKIYTDWYKNKLKDFFTIF